MLLETYPPGLLWSQPLVSSPDLEPTLFVIRYHYPGTHNGRDVGEVYLQDVSARWPWAAPGSFSYSKLPSEATHYATEDEALSVLEEHPSSWPDAEIVPLSIARPLA